MKKTSFAKGSHISRVVPVHFKTKLKNPSRLMITYFLEESNKLLLLKIYSNKELLIFSMFHLVNTTKEPTTSLIWTLMSTIIMMKMWKKVSGSPIGSSTLLSSPMAKYWSMIKEITVEQAPLYWLFLSAITKSVWNKG